jgi:hypothetical protein
VRILALLKECLLTTISYVNLGPTLDIKTYLGSAMAIIWTVLVKRRNG